MSGHREQLAETVGALRFQTLTTATWFGRPVARLTPRVRRELTLELTVAGVEYLLGQHLYTHFYLPGGPTMVAETPPTPRQVTRTDFVERLSAANTGVGRWEPGWEVTSVGDEGVTIHRGGITVAAGPDALGSPAAAHEVGASVRLFRPREWTSRSPGFYVAVGDGAPLSQQGDDARLVRWYWNLVPSGAEVLIGRGTELLNRTGIPFQLKVLADARTYGRCDAGVLYAAKSDAPTVAELLVELLPHLRAHLKDGVPALTKPLAPGLGLAEDPGGGESFGQHRCRLLAAGLVRAQQQGQRTVRARTQVVVEQLEEHGIDIAAPYLQPGSADTYRLPTRSARSHGTDRRPDPVPADDCLGAANTIGHLLARQSVWRTMECTWLGLAPGGDHSAEGPSEHVYRPVGSSLYDGASGIAWFLGELGVATGDSSLENAALGGIRHALRLVADAGPGGGYGLFQGAVGVALVAARLGTILDAPELLARARTVLHHGDPEPGVNGPDLLTGTAGTVLGLLAAHALLDDVSLQERAVGLGHALVAAAESGPEGASWRWRPEQCHRNLTGYAHGTAGITHALLELYAVTGDVSFRDCARLAREYDGTALDPVVGNWADYRLGPGPRRRRWVPRQAVTWCHGAPGIAVPRLRAVELLGDPADRVDAVVALSTTRATLRTALAVSTPNFSLCHGLAGNVEIVERGERVLGETSSDFTTIVRHGMTRYGTDDHGSVSTEPPGLMTGLAGVGAFYLRRAGAPAPSPMFIGIERWDAVAGALPGDPSSGDQRAAVVPAEVEQLRG